jgi:hypothetical protein
MGYNFDEPGRFAARALEPAQPGVHALCWIPDGWTGVVIGHLVTDRATADQLVARLNGGRCDRCGRTDTVKGRVMRGGVTRVLCHANPDGTTASPDCYTEER